MWVSIVLYFKLLTYFIFYIFKTLGAVFFQGHKMRSCSYQDTFIDDWSKKMLEIVNAKIQVHSLHSQEYSPQHFYMFLSNHASLFDIPVIFQTFPFIQLRMVAKKELKSYPLLGYAMEKLYFIFIDRKNRTQAIKNLAQVKQTMGSKGIKVWMAPEGTRSLNPEELQPLKKGAFILAIELQAKIIPIWIRGTSRIVPAKTLRISPGQEVDIFVGEEIDAGNYSLQEKDKLMERYIYEINSLKKINK